MAEDKVRKTLYKYNANANLVLQAERDGPRLNEPTGEVCKASAWRLPVPVAFRAQACPHGVVRISFA